MAQQAGSKPALDDAPAATAAPDGGSLDRQPVVYEKKKKKKYSRGLREPQKAEQGLSRAAERLAAAVADGLSEYRDRRSASAGKKRDGAVRDAVRNVGRGLEKAIEKAAKVPTDLTEKISTRRLARLVIPPPFSGFVR